MFETATLEDIIKYTRGMFDENGMSILMAGADYNCDLMEVWRKNFKPTKNKTLHKSVNTARDIKKPIVPDNQHGK